MDKTLRQLRDDAIINGALVLILVATGLLWVIVKIKESQKAVRAML